MSVGATENRSDALSARKRQTILYFGNHWDAENRTSSHHVASWLARHHDVHYIECPGLRAPKASWRDLRKVLSKVSRCVRAGQPARRGVKVHTLLQIPFHGFGAVRWINGAWLRHSVGRIMRRHGIHNPIAWFTVPHVAPLVGRLGERHSVYYCIDDYASLPHIDRASIARFDHELTETADTVFVASETLYEDKRRLNPNTHVSPHGVDVGHFGRAQDSQLTCPFELVDAPRPIIGFFGLVERWIDLDIIAFLARQRPQWTFLMIGRVAVPTSETPRLPNLRFLGQRSYEDLPVYGKQFDACMIPYRLTQQVWHANPLKLREYLAMGKPIVSVSTPEIDKFADVVAIAHSPQEFLDKLDAMLAQPASPDDAQRRIDRVMDASWESRLERVWEIVEASQRAKKVGRSAGLACKLESVA